jgi:class 3 adenylate cyclase/DNA-binding winged helix-turn-helix (wHTH) protein/tetratricopeptide (TPR) repeat protein
MRYGFGDYTFDTERYELRRAGTLIKLRPKVFNLLAYLIAHRERVVTKQELHEQLWSEVSVAEATLNTCIRAARQAVGDTGQDQHVIQTLHRRGFRFVAELKEGPSVRQASAMSPSLGIDRRLEPPGSPAPSLAMFWPDAQEPVAPELPTAPVVEEEHKLVTVVSAGLVDATVLAAHLGPEAMHGLMHRCFSSAQRLLPPYGGTLTHVAGEGFLALFGAPLAQEDHARRAVLAAVALQQAWHASNEGGSTPMPLGIGVHTGSVVVGSLGEDSQRAYTAMGATVELAQRLRQRAAPGAILLSAATQQLVQAEVEVEDAGMGMAVEAASGPVYRVRGIRQRRSGVLGRGGRAVSHFVGRERELALLHERLQAATQRRGQVIGIAGEPGIGKSRLLDEFHQSLGNRPVTYAEGHCLAYGGATPYLPVRALLCELAGIAETDGAEAITAKVHARLAAVGLAPADEAPYLLSILGLAADEDQPALLEPRAFKARTFSSLHQLCLASSRGQPLILAVENLHWSDPTSEAWLTALVERIAGAAILLLATYRSGYRPAWLGQSYATQLTLPGLSVHDSRVLMQTLPQAEAIPEHLRQAIVDKAAGNPFFLEELTRVAGEYSDMPATLRIPDTVQAVLAARIDRLPPPAKQLLQAAAVLGVEVSVPLLQAITEMPEPTFIDGLRHLQAAELLYESRLLPELVYTFTHTLTQEVAYESLLHPRRRALHDQIVDALESRYAERLADHVEQLAYHAFQGERWAKAFAYYRQAADKALARSAYREAVGCFEQALGALTHLPEGRHTMELAIDLRLALRTALYPMGDWERMRAYLQEAESLAVALDDARRLAQVSAFLSHYFHMMGPHERAIAFGQRALALATDSGEISLQALSNQYLGQAYMTQSDYHRAIAYLGQSVASFDRAPHHEPLGQVILPTVFSRYLLIRCHAHLGTFAEGRSLADEGIQIAEAVADRASLLFALRGSGVLALCRGDLPRAIPQLERAMAICREAHHTANFRGVAADLGEALIMDGRVTDAVPLLAQAIEESASAKDGRAEANCCRSMAEAQLLSGHLEEAHSLAERALALNHEHQERGNQAYTLRLLGEIAARRQPPEADQAEAAYRQALALAEELGMHPLLAHCHLGLGTLYAQLHRPDQARAELSTAIALYRAMQMTFWLPGAEATLAGVAEPTSLNAGSGAQILTAE